MWSAFRVQRELDHQVLMELKGPKALPAYLALKDSKEQLEIQAVLVTQAPLDQKAPLEMLALLGPQEKLEIQVMQKNLLLRIITLLLMFAHISLQYCGLEKIDSLIYCNMTCSVTSLPAVWPFSAGYRIKQSFYT